MITNAHKQLARRFNKPPMPYKTLPTEALMEILEMLFTEEEALIVSKIPMLNASADKIAKRVKRPVDEVRPILDGMVELQLTPEPDAVLRFWLFFEGSDEFAPLPAPRLPDFFRGATTVVEWGGVLLN